MKIKKHNSVLCFSRFLLKNYNKNIRIINAYQFILHKETKDLYFLNKLKNKTKKIIRLKILSHIFLVYSLCFFAHL